MGGEKCEGALGMDFSTSYMIHAMGIRRHIGKVKGFEGVTLKYVLARTSNYARMAYPAIKHAIDAGFIPAEEAELLAN